MLAFQHSLVAIPLLEENTPPVFLSPPHNEVNLMYRVLSSSSPDQQSSRTDLATLTK